MGGKAAILLVLGFSMIFLVVGHNYNNITSRSLDNYFRYYNETNAQNIAVSGANMALAEIFFESSWDDGYDKIPFNGGELSVHVTNPLGDGSDTPPPEGKVAVCHIPPGNPENAHTIWISQNAVQAHLNHGDYLGPCNYEENVARSNITIISEGKVEIFEEEIVKSVVIVLSPSSFSRFAYFQGSPSNNIWWTENDSVWGPMHIQGNLQVHEHPYFAGKVTSSGNIKRYNNNKHKEHVQIGTEWKYIKVKNGYYDWRLGWVDPVYDWVEVPVYKDVWVYEHDPVFKGGYESGENMEMQDTGVDDVKEAAAEDGHIFSGEDTVIVTFIKDSINYKFSVHDLEGTTVAGSELTSNGVIFVESGTLRLSGTVRGKYTIGVNGEKNYWTNKGNVYIDNDIVYENDPRGNPQSPDVLGIVAKNDVLITNNAANNNGVNIHASIYSEEGGFGAEDYDSRPPSGEINLLGGIIQYERLAVGTFSGSTTNHGFDKNYRYDDRLMIISPPYFPGTGTYEIVSWFE